MEKSGERVMSDRSYASLAKVYDLFLGDVPYGEWLDYITGVLRAHGISDGLVLELGCGTGTFTQMLAKAGYDMIGVDSSPEMLQIASEKQRAACSGPKGQGADADILYLQQDMREFELYGTVRAVVCVCDSINYMADEEDLLRVFSLVNNYLDPGGVFVFDMKTVHYLADVMGDSVAAQHRKEGTLIWENAYFEEDQTNEYDLTFFLKEPDGRYVRHRETHLQRAYPAETVKSLLARAGLVPEQVLDADTRGEPRPDSERLYFVARECGK